MSRVSGTPLTSPPRSILSSTHIATYSFCTLYPWITKSASSATTSVFVPSAFSSAMCECQRPPARTFCRS